MVRSQSASYIKPEVPDARWRSNSSIHVLYAAEVSIEPKWADQAVRIFLGPIQRHVSHRIEAQSDSHKWS